MSSQEAASKRRKTDDENLPPYVSTFTEANVPQQEQKTNTKENCSIKNIHREDNLRPCICSQGKKKRQKV